DFLPVKSLTCTPSGRAILPGLVPTETNDLAAAHQRQGLLRLASPAAPSSQLKPGGVPALLTLFGKKQKFCDGVSRRNFLKIGAFGAGLTLADMLRLRSAAATSGKAVSSQKAAIMIYLPGGPSHMDMYDLKPEAPMEFRGEFKPIATNVPGVQISE